MRWIEQLPYHRCRPRDYRTPVALRWDLTNIDCGVFVLAHVAIVDPSDECSVADFHHFVDALTMPREQLSEVETVKAFVIAGLLLLQCFQSVSRACVGRVDPRLDLSTEDAIRLIFRYLYNLSNPRLSIVQ